MFLYLEKQIDSVRTRNDIGNINSFIRDKHLKRFPLLYSKFIWSRLSPYGTLRRMTIFVIGTLGVLILVLMEGDYWTVTSSHGKNVRYTMDIEFSQIHEMVYMHDIVNSDSKKKPRIPLKNSLMLRMFSRKQHHGH